MKKDMNDNLEKSALISISKSLPKIANVLRDIESTLQKQNVILYHIAERLDDEVDEITTIHCVTTSGVERIISMSVYELIDDWRGDCKICPENDAIVMSAIVFDEELIGNKIPVNSDFEAVMKYFIETDENGESENN